jgi:16S rRNA processing protein RimM
MVVLGRISAPFGIQGWVKIHLFGGDPQTLVGMPKWWLNRDPDSREGWEALELHESREQGGLLIARLQGVVDRTSALALKGLYIGAPRDLLPMPAEGEFYWGDLIGLTVITEQGEQLGKVSGLIESGAHDVLVVRHEQSGDESCRERLLPFVANVIRQVDVAGRVIRVDWGADW